MNVNNYKQDEAKTKFSWNNLKRMLVFVKPYKKEMVVAFLIGIIANILVLFIPKIISYVVDVLFINKDFLNIVLFTFFILILIIISVFLNKIRRDKMLIVLNKVANDLKMAVFEKLQYLPNNYFDTRSHGKIYTCVSTYPDEVSIIFCYILIEIILDIIYLVWVIIFMLTSNVKLSLISILLSLILVVFFVILAPIRRRLKHTLNDKAANVNAYLSESINGIRITQSFNRETKNEEILRDIEGERIHAFKKTLFVGNLNWSLTGIFDMIASVLVYYIGLRYMYPSITIGIILAVDSYSSRFWDPISYLTSSYNELMDASAYLERIFELLDEPLVITNKKNARELDIKGNVEFKNVKFSYNADRVILDNLNLEIKAGEKIGLVGETGSGKSTILNLISRFYDINSGEILVDGVNIGDIRLDVLRKNISMMLQDNYLFQRSVYDNLVLDKKINKDEVIKICKMLEIDDMIKNLENGYDTILLNNGSNLSSGERQLLCLARIMVQNPKIVILDEATSNVDLITEKKIEKAFNIVTKDRTTIMVAHRISTVKNCDKIFLIKDKRVYESGNHQELMKMKKEYYNLYRRQALD